MINALFVMLASTALFVRWGLSQDQHTSSDHKRQRLYHNDCGVLSRKEYEQETAMAGGCVASVNGEPQESIA